MALEKFILGTILPTPKGNYSAGTNYDKFNMVTSNGGAYIAVKNNVQGIQPGVTSGWQTYWQCVGNGIIGIVKSAETSSQATFTVTYSNGSTSTYTIDKLTNVGDGTITFGTVADEYSIPESGETLQTMMGKLAKNAEITQLTFTRNANFVHANHNVSAVWYRNGMGFFNLDFVAEQFILAGVAADLGNLSPVEFFPEFDTALSVKVLGKNAVAWLSASDHSLRLLVDESITAGDKVTISGVWYRFY